MYMYNKNILEIAQIAQSIEGRSNVLKLNQGTEWVWIDIEIFLTYLYANEVMQFHLILKWIHCWQKSGLYNNNILSRNSRRGDFFPFEILFCYLETGA